MPRKSARDRRLKLTDVAFSRDREMPSPYLSYRRSGRRYLVDLGSRNYAECLSRNTKYDLVVTARDYILFLLIL